MSKVMTWVEEHPAQAGLGVVLIGAVLIYALSGSGGGAPASDNGAAAYYSAVASQTASGNALQAVQIQEQGNTARTQIAANVATHSTDVSAATQLAYAPFQVQIEQTHAEADTAQGLIAALGNAAAQPGTTVTNTSKSNGFLGIGGGTKTTTSYVPNQAAIGAQQSLSGLFSSFLQSGDLYASH